MMLFGIPWMAISGVVSGAFLHAMWFGGEYHPMALRVGLSLFFLPFWAIGFSMLGAPLWLRLRQRKWLYAVTDRSALIVGAFRCSRWRRHDLFTPDRADHRNGLTDLIFSTASYTVRGHQPPEGFINLPTDEAFAAEQALLDLIDGDRP